MSSPSLHSLQPSFLGNHIIMSTLQDTTEIENLPEYILNPASHKDVANNFRVYAEQVAYHAASPKKLRVMDVLYPYNHPSNKQCIQLAGEGRWMVLAGRHDRYCEIIVGQLYKCENPNATITFSLLMAEYLESLSEDEEP